MPLHNAAPRTVTRRNVPILVRTLTDAKGKHRVLYYVPDGAFSISVPSLKVADIVVSALRAFLHARIDIRSRERKAPKKVKRNT